MTQHVQDTSTTPPTTEQCIEFVHKAVAATGVTQNLIAPTRIELAIAYYALITQERAA